MFKRQGELKAAKSRQPPVVLLSKKTNINNNNNKCGTEIGEGEGPESTPIFVWNDPDGIKVSSKSSVDSSGKNKVPPDPDPPLADLDLDLAHKLDVSAAKINGSQVSEPIIAPTLSAPPASSKARSMTPPLTVKVPPVSQRRRSKTPTPNMKKEPALPRQSIGQQKSNELNLQRKPNDREVSDRNKPDSASYPSGFRFPYPYPAWGPTQLQGPRFYPATMPLEYYQNFYKVLEYYSSLSPDQQKSLFPFSPNGSQTSVSFIMTFHQFNCSFITRYLLKKEGKFQLKKSNLV